MQKNGSPAKRRSTVMVHAERQRDVEMPDRVAPILIRIYKEENTLEVWKQDRTGKFALLKSYPICKFSGKRLSKLPYSIDISTSNILCVDV
jgi:murein L,D-transpeptidase YafK